MSASEKLKALKAWPFDDAEEELLNVLPQIVAVAEAAEAIVQAEDDWDVYAKTPALDEALSALDESLGTNRAEGAPRLERTE